MQTALNVTTLGLFILMMVVGLIELTTALTSATLPSTLSGFTTAGPVLIAAMTLLAIGGGLIALFSERERGS